MDSHNIFRGREHNQDILAEVKAQTLVLGITSDILFPPAEQRFIAEQIPGAQYLEISSFYGHDGFLVETESLTHEIGNFLKSTGGTSKASHYTKLQH